MAMPVIQIRTFFFFLLLLSAGHEVYGYGRKPTFPVHQMIMKGRKLMMFVSAEIDYVDPHHNTSHEKTPGSGG